MILVKGLQEWWVALIVFILTMVTPLTAICQYNLRHLTACTKPNTLHCLSAAAHTYQNSQDNFRVLLSILLCHHTSPADRCPLGTFGVQVRDPDLEDQRGPR